MILAHDESFILVTSSKFLTGFARATIVPVYSKVFKQNRHVGRLIMEKQ